MAVGESITLADVALLAYAPSSPRVLRYALPTEAETMGEPM